MVWYSHLFKNIPPFVVIHTVKGFSTVNESVDVFLEFSCFLCDSTNAGNLIILSELSTMTHLSWVALQGMAHSFIALCKPLLHGKAVIHEEESHFADKEIKAQKT